MRNLFPMVLAGTVLLARAAPPAILTAVPDRNPVPKYERLEISITLGTAYANPDNPDEIDLSCAFTSPSGKKWNLNGFHSGKSFKVRFAANEIGTWKFAVTAKDPAGTVTSVPDSFSVKESDKHGWVRIAPNKRYFRQDDGAAWHGVGVCYPWSVEEKALDSLKAAGANSIVYWNSSFDAAGNGGGKYLIESIDSGLGRYDERKAERVDQILAWCEARDLKMIFCIWPHPFLGDEINPTRKSDGWEAFYDVNPYKNIVRARDFYDNAAAWESQKKMYRYLVARWGYSPALEHWWTVVEATGTDGWITKGSAVVETWARKVKDWFAANDPFGHPNSGSQHGNLENFWANGYQIFDLANREIYYGNSGYASVVQETDKLWPQFEKPILIGEIGNSVNAKTFHQVPWSGLATGAASAPYWWNYPDKWSAEYWPHLRACTGFVKTIPFGNLNAPQRLKPAVSGASAYAIVSAQGAFGWILNDNASISGKSLALQGLVDGGYTLEWYDTWKGTSVSTARVSAAAERGRNPRGGPMSLSLHGRSQGLHFLRLEWMGGTRMQILIL